jgi:hypothetical protein
LSELDRNWVNSVDKRLEGLEARVSAVERVLLTPKGTKIVAKRSPKGPTNAIMKLIQEGFLNSPKLVKEIEQELKRQGYYYSLQTLDATIRRMNVSKILTRTGKRGQWRYAVRK